MEKPHRPGRDSHFRSHSLALEVVLLALIAGIVSVLPISFRSIEISLYLPLRSLLLVFAIGVSFLIFGLGWNSLERERKGALTLLGCGFLSSALITFVQLFSHPGFPPFITDNPLKKAAFLAMASRSVTATSLILAGYSQWREPFSKRARYLGLMLAIAISLGFFFIGVYHLDVVPPLVIEGVRTTGFKRSIDCVIFGTYLTAAFGFYRRMDRPGAVGSRELCAGTIVMALAQAISAFSRGQTDGFTLLGHIYAAIAYLSFYRVLFLTHFRSPYLELEESRKRLQRAVEVRDEFLMIASHELKTPLTPLKMQLSSLSRQAKAAGLQGERIVSLARSADLQLDRLIELIDQILDVTQVGSGKLSLDLEESNLSECVSEQLSQFRARAMSSGVSFNLQIQERIICEFDRARIQQVLVNLLENAMRFGLDQPIDVVLTSDGSRARLLVRDRGIGIAKEDQSRIFVRFERISSPFNVEGLGLGLFIAHEIVTAHGGVILVESEPGKGATFVVEIPLRPSRALGRE